MDADDLQLTQYDQLEYPPPVSRQPQVHQPPPVVVVQQQPGHVSVVQGAGGLVTSQTTVVTHQPVTNWSSGICDCCNDMKSCCCVLFFGHCFVCCVARRMGENCCVPWCTMGGLTAMRAVLRTRHNIQGDICHDSCMLSCCGPCVLCQMSREMDRLGYPPQGCCC